MTTFLSQLSLFPEHTVNIDSIIAAVPGLSYTPEYITKAQELKLISIIDQQPWGRDYQRRIQLYGSKYDYQDRALSNISHRSPLPDWLIHLCRNIYEQGLFPNQPNHIVINEYMPGQGIGPHIDDTSRCSDTIGSLSLGSLCVMDLSKDVIHSILLKPRSLLVMSGEARYLWKHGIAKRKHDKYNGTVITRTRRLSLTFRVLL